MPLQGFWIRSDRVVHGAEGHRHPRSVWSRLLSTAAKTDRLGYSVSGSLTLERSGAATCTTFTLVWRASLGRAAHGQRTTGQRRRNQHSLLTQQGQTKGRCANIKTNQPLRSGSGPAHYSPQSALWRAFTWFVCSHVFYRLVSLCSLPDCR